MKVVIAGGGNVGVFIAEDLAKAGHEIVIVEVDADRVAEAAPTCSAGISWVTADACEVSEFSRANVEAADVVAAVTGDDEDNLVISLLAKQEFAVPRVVARVNNPKNEWMFNEMWGVDVSVSTPHLLSALVEEAVSIGDLVRITPNHVCPVTNLFDKVVFVRGDEVLGAVKTEFGKFGGMLDKVKSQTQTVLNTLDQAQTRTNMMNRALRKVEALPDDEAQALLPGVQAGEDGADG